MIIIMGGYPKSGKTKVVNYIADKLDAITISPENLCDDVSDDDRQDAAIEAWKISNECLIEIINNSSDDQVIIYDTCGSNDDQLRQIYKNASKNNHTKAYIFVHSKMSDCINRSDIDSNIYKMYKNRFKDILTKVKKHSDEFFVVYNNGSKKDLENKSLEIINAITRVCQS